MRISMGLHNFPPLLFSILREKSFSELDFVTITHNCVCVTFFSHPNFVFVFKHEPCSCLYALVYINFDKQSVVVKQETITKIVLFLLADRNFASIQQ